MTEYAFEGPTRSSPALTWSFAAQTYARDQAYPFTATIAPRYQATIQAAFDRWSAVSGLSFTQVADQPGAAIRIGFGSFASIYTVGETIIRSSGGFLANDTVVRLLDPAVYALSLAATGLWSYGQTSITLYQVALHEIGHALGLDHTTDPVTNLYPIASSLNGDLAAGDIQGINRLYPLYTVAALDPVQVKSPAGSAYHFVITRHDDLSLPRTINYSVVGAAYPGLAGTQPADPALFAAGALPAGQLTFGTGVDSVSLTVAVAGNIAPQPDAGFVVSISGAAPGALATERGSFNAVILDGGEFAAGLGAHPIYRFFSGADGTHFFTASKSERNTLIQTRADLAYEGVKLGAVADSSTDPAAAPVYRFFDLRQGTHFYTADASERDAVLGNRADLLYEGVGFYEHADPRPGDVAVYRLFETQFGTHFITSDPAERAMILATRSDYADEGIAFYAPTT